MRYPGKQRLKELGVSKVYDLRSDTEMVKYQTPCPEIEGIDVIRVPVFKLEDYSPEMMAKCVNVGCSGSPTYPDANIVADSRFELYASGKTEVRLHKYCVYQRD